MLSRVVLAGFAGTGKTTVGRLLADRLGLSFADLDAEIERRAGRTVRQLFDGDGEAAFRRLESMTLRDLCASDVDILALGGGTLVDPDNRSLVCNNQRVVCLTCGATEIFRRLQGDTDRPLLRDGGLTTIEYLLAERSASYSQFMQVATDGLTPEKVARAVSDLLALDELGHVRFSRDQTSSVAFESGALASLADLLGSHGFGRRLHLVTDRVVGRLGDYSDLRTNLVTLGFDVTASVIPAGEAAKQLHTLAELFSDARSHRLNRQATIVGVGGGVVCDLAGLLAATYLRGLPLVLCPTTLLAQVDAAIGGKTGVDFEGVKNLVGSFYPARLVVIDPSVLKSLASEQLSDGLAEIIKIGVMLSVGIVRNLDAVVAPEGILTNPAIVRAAAVAKIGLVNEDPFEGGRRALLNFGHTVGHAIEAASEYSLSHGRCVSIGMAAEANLAERLGVCSAGIPEKITALLRRLRLPTGCSEIHPDKVWEILLQDKKHCAGQLRFALPQDIGQGVVVPVAEADARSAVDFALAGTAGAMSL